MRAGKTNKRVRNTQAGNVLFLMAASLVVLLGISALAIDLVSLYLARSEAQRAADAAALAGAKKFVDSGYTSGLVGQSTAETMATQEAITIGSRNLVGGQAANIQSSDVTFDFSLPANPRITVAVQRTTARGNPMPTFFGKALGFAQADVSAVATAEAYNPSGGNLPVGISCLKPWIMPNCDPDPSHSGPSGPYCSGAMFVDSNGSVVNPGPYPTGTIGMLMTLKPGDPSQAAAPSQFYPIQLPPGGDPVLCPDCAQNTGSLGPGAALYAQNIACCNTNRLYCGQQVDVDLQTGNVVGPTRMGVECLIHQLPNGQGQDILDTSTVPFQIMGGSNNPNPALRGQWISSSDSIMTVPLYDGHTLCPGGSCGASVTIVGFLQLFLTQADKGAQGTTSARVLNVSGCGPGSPGGGPGSGGSGSGGGSSGGGASIGSGGALFPIRLVRQ